MKKKIGDYHSDSSKGGTEEGSLDSFEKFRAKIESFEYVIHAFFCLIWNWSLRFHQNGDNLTVGTVTVPRNPNILKEWEIIIQDDDFNGEMSFHDEGGDVEIEVTCPSSLVKGLPNLQTKGGGIFYRKWKRCPLDALKLDLSPTVPIVVWMHGGGFTVGSARDFSSKLAYELYSNHCDGDKKKGQQIILLSINYRCAPEKPFPASVIDCLSVAEFLMDKFDSPIHVAGFFAGGNLASVTAFECMRRYPLGKLRR